MKIKIDESVDETCEIKYDDADVVMNRWQNGRFGIPIHDGGTSMVVINFCPWCGIKLSNEDGGIRMIDVN
ncbi:MAG: hypothetical protein ABIQ40_01565 [Bacteroidia bacterium]